MSFSYTNDALENDIKNLQLNLTQILTSDCHDTTSEIINHIKYINNALDNIKLDYEFQRGSKNWAKQFDSNEIKLNESGIKQLIAKGNDLTQQLNTRLHTNIIKNKELNQIRETHNWAYNSLVEYLQALHPYASSSYARLDNMAHQLGVTDRFVGYRNNLTRYANQPTNVHTIWADRKLPQTSAPDWKNWTHAFQHNAPSTTTLSSMEKAQPIELQHPSTTEKTASQSFIYTNNHNSHMNKAGISINYPGQTETMDRYTKPNDPFYSPSLAVAQPDYTSIGRPLAHLVTKSSFSEYTNRYTFPDASKIERYPWLRP